MCWMVWERLGVKTIPLLLKQLCGATCGSARVMSLSDDVMVASPRAIDLFVFSANTQRSRIEQTSISGD